MSEGKRYYWLRLQDGFFQSKRIKKLRRSAGGDTLTIIYLKMQLAAIKHEGHLEYSGIEETFAEELALDLDEKTANVEKTIDFLLKHDLMIESKDKKDYYLPFAAENVGSEGAAAQRQREHRARVNSACHEDVLQACDNVTGESQICNGEIEKEKEIEKEIEKEYIDLKVYSSDSSDAAVSGEDVKRVVDAWNDTGLPMVQRISTESSRGKMLRCRIREYGIDDVLKVMEKVRNSSFLKGQNTRGWSATFDWVVKPENFLKVLEGQYDGKRAPGNTKTSAFAPSDL